MEILASRAALSLWSEADYSPRSGQRRNLDFRAASRNFLCSCTDQDDGSEVSD